MVEINHVDRIRFYRCQEPKFISVWKKNIGRIDNEFKNIKGSPCVCSNHFEHGHPTKEMPHPTLYLKG